MEIIKAIETGAWNQAAGEQLRPPARFAGPSWPHFKFRRASWAFRGPFSKFQPASRSFRDPFSKFRPASRAFRGPSLPASPAK